MTIKNPILLPNHPKFYSVQTVKFITETCGMANIRKNLSSKEISEKAIDLISNTRRTASQSNYESAWGNWVSWCSRKQTDPFSTHLREVLDFLAEIYNNFPAISVFQKVTEGFSVGKHPKVFNLMATWLWNSPEIFNVTSNKQTFKYKNGSIKLTIKIALTSASRCLNQDI